MSDTRTPRRVAAVLAAGVLITIGVLVLEMSGSASRTAGSDHVNPSVFAATVPGGGVVCQPIEPPPEAMAGVRLLIGTYGRAVPTLDIRFLSVDGRTIAQGRLPGGGRQGYVAIPVSRTGRVGDTSSVCLHVGGSGKVALAGQRGPEGTETIDGRPVPGVISLLYTRRGAESWWQLLPTLDARFGLGKAPFYGGWTLPLVALLIIALWVGTLRLLVRELR